jgi:hypothetical protein
LRTEKHYVKVVLDLDDVQKLLAELVGVRDRMEMAAMPISSIVDDGAPV